MEERKQRKAAPKSVVDGDQTQRRPKPKRVKPPQDEAVGAQRAETAGEKPKEKKRKPEVAKAPEDTRGSRSSKAEERNRGSKSDNTQEDAKTAKDGRRTPEKKKDVEDTEGRRGTEGSAGGRSGKLKSDADAQETASLYQDADGTTPSYFGSNPLQEFRPPTLTGITELPVKDFFLMVLLWCPRFFVPWISAWHEFNVFIMVEPDKLDAKATDLFVVDLSVFGGACAVSIIASAIADLANMRYYVYLVLLVLYTLCPIAGGYVDVVLRSRFYDKDLYNHWFSSIVLMRIAMAIPFIFFPVQFTCIFTEKANMSRQAHYNWTAFFAFLEFVNAYVAFWVIPPKCPTSEWAQIVVWVLILALLYLLIVLTLTFSIIVKSMRYTLMTCLKSCGVEQEKYVSDAYNEKVFKDRVPKDLRLKKLQWFGFVLIPLVFSSFVFATLERFVPDEDWDKHYVLSATSMFYLGRIVGVAVMVLTLFWIRHGFKRVLKLPIFRGDVLVLGLPHLFNILALMVLAGRYATLSSPSPGEVIVGPIPDSSKSVAVFVNLMYRNKTVCIRSDYFRPVKVRAFHFVTREIYEPGLTKFNISLTPEPGANPVVATNFVMHLGSRETWNIYSINLFSYLNKDVAKDEDKYREFMNKPRVLEHYVSSWRNNFKKSLERGPLLLTIVNLEHELLWWHASEPPFGSYLWTLCLQYGKPPEPNQICSSSHQLHLEHIPRHMAQWYPLDRPGTWYVWATRYNFVISPPHKFHVDDHSLYLLSLHTIALFNGSLEGADRGKEFKAVVRTKTFKIGEIARPGVHHLPSKRILQRDKVIQTGMFFAGMSAGGLFVGIVYLFWMDPPFPGWQTTSLAVFWTLMISAAESPKVKLVDVGLIVSSVLLCVQIFLTALHVFASANLYTPDFNFRKRPD